MTHKLTESESKKVDDIVLINVNNIEDNKRDVKLKGSIEIDRIESHSSDNYERMNNQEQITNNRPEEDNNVSNTPYVNLNQRSAPLIRNHVNRRGRYGINHQFENVEITSDERYHRNVGSSNRLLEDITNNIDPIFNLFLVFLNECANDDDYISNQNRLSEDLPPIEPNRDINNNINTHMRNTNDTSTDNRNSLHIISNLNNISRRFNNDRGACYCILGLSKNEIDALRKFYYINKNNNEIETCSICLNNFEHTCFLLELKCLHIFHMKCIKPWLELHRSCPLCRVFFKRNNGNYFILNNTD